MAAQQAMSQSLLHQVTYSDNVAGKHRYKGEKVSIPFTSGHVFRRLHKSWANEKLIVSQSLLHQVTYSDAGLNKEIVDSIRVSQSLLHQVTYSDAENGSMPAGLERVSIPFTSGHVFRQWANRKTSALLVPCLNPFYIRSRIPTTSVLRRVAESAADVSIPFTSGHVFRPGDGPIEEEMSRMSQSLLHQVTYSDASRPASRR